MTAVFIEISITRVKLKTEPFTNIETKKSHQINRDKMRLKYNVSLDTKYTLMEVLETGRT